MSLECSKIQFCGHHVKAETAILTVPVRVVGMCATKFILLIKHECAGLDGRGE
jgi:hypothetical protein